MDEVVIDDAEIVAAIHGVEELLAHAHERGCAAGREIQPADQFQPSRLGGFMKLGRVVLGRRVAPGRDRRVDSGAIVAEGGRQRLEERDARSDRQRRIVRKDFVGKREAGGLAAARQQRLAEFDKTGRALARRLAALAHDQRAAAVGDALQHFAEKGGVHRLIRSGRQKTANDRRRR